MYSHWEKKYWFSNVDFTIVGSGIVGLLTAIRLKEKKPQACIRLIDSHAIPQGASTKNAGFACFGTVGEILDDLKHIEEDQVAATISARFSGLQLLSSIIDSELYTYRNCGGSEIFLSQEKFDFHADHVHKINNLCKNAIGHSPFKISQKPPVFNICDQLIYNALEGQLNPVLLMRALMTKAQSLGVDICLGHRVSSIEDTNVVSVNGDKLSFRSEQVMVTNNAFAGELLDDLDITPARNQVLVSQPFSHPIPEGTYHYDRGYVYFRNISGNRILIGGARNLDPETETTNQFNRNENIINHLKSFCETHLVHGKFEIESQWSGIMGLGNSKRPIIKNIRPGLRIGVRLGGMGIAIGAAVAYQLCEDI